MNMNDRSEMRMAIDGLVRFPVKRVSNGGSTVMFCLMSQSEIKDWLVDHGEDAWVIIL